MIVKTDILKKKRLQKGLSKVELAKLTGVSTCVISNFENGRNIPRPKSLKKICTALQTDIDELFVFEKYE